ncbi:MAG: twin-arginine translocase TatA/TatE family subunit [Bacteroidales bacterium]
MNIVLNNLAFISGTEILIILLAVLLLFGAEKIPEITHGLGKGIREFRKVTSDIKREFDESTRDIKRDVEDLKDDLEHQAGEASDQFRSYINDSEVVKDIKDVEEDLKG